MIPEQFPLTITSLAHDGRGIGFLSKAFAEKRGLAVFVPNALPGETVLCQKRKEARNYLEAQKLETLGCAFTPARPICPHLQACNACPLQRLPYDSQLRWKEKLAKDALLRIGKLNEQHLDAVWEGAQGAPLLNGFRNKVTLAFGKDAQGRAAYGYRERQSHTIVPVQQCALIEEKAQDLLSVCGQLVLQSELPVYEKQGFWRFLTLRRARTVTDAALSWHILLVTSQGSKSERQAVRQLADKILCLAPDLGSVTHEERRLADHCAQGQKRIFSVFAKSGGDARLVQNLRNKLFHLDISSFFQVNDAAHELLVQAAIDMDQATEGPLLDLFCGVGAPGQLLAANHDVCLGLELDKRAIAKARINAALNGLNNWQYKPCDLHKPVKGHFPERSKCATVLVDPPRSGLTPALCRQILTLSPRHLLYISCNPVTLARDSVSLASDYQLGRIMGIDLFPHTQHLECCSLWERKK